MTTFDLKQIDFNAYLGPTLKILPQLATGALVIVLSSTLATLTWDFMPSSPLVNPPVINSTSKSASAGSEQSDATAAYNKIGNMHLFGIARKDKPKIVASTAPPIEEEAPDTQLRLTLKGVVATGDMMDAWAIIADRAGKEDNYAIDSALPGGATLKSIYADRVILLHNGRMETLRLPKTAVNNVSKNRRSNRRSNNRRNSRRTSAVTNTSNINRVSASATSTLRNYRDKLLNDPQSVMNSVRAEPYRVAGRLKGYRIFPGRDKKLFGDIGLEPGDIVTSVNGIELDSPLKGLEIMQKLTDAADVSVNVLRNGVNQTFVAPMN